MALLRRLCGAVLNVPLLVCAPILRASDARRRASAVRSAAAPRRPRDTAPDKLARPGPSAADLQRMRDELRRVLDEREDGRILFPHLARFERKFTVAGLRTLDKLPVGQLRRALVDFETLVSNWSSAPLAELRSRMAVKHSDRASASSMWIAAVSVASQQRPPPASFANRLARKPVDVQPGLQVDIADVSMTRFEAAGGQWQYGERSGAPA